MLIETSACFFATSSGGARGSQRHYSPSRGTPCYKPPARRTTRRDGVRSPADRRRGRSLARRCAVHRPRPDRKGVHRVFDGLDVKPSRALLGRWCREHLSCCVRDVARRQADGTLFDPSLDGEVADARAIEIDHDDRSSRSGWIQNIANNEDPTTREGTEALRRRRWSIGLLLAATIALLVGTGLAAAAFDSDSNSSNYNSCDYSGYVSYNTSGPQYSYAQSFSTCHAYIVLSYWECPSGCTEEAYSGWIAYPGFPVFDNRTVVTPPNVYGYHQIRKPSSSYSATIETHAN